MAGPFAQRAKNRPSGTDMRSAAGGPILLLAASAGWFSGAACAPVRDVLGTVGLDAGGGNDAAADRRFSGAPRFSPPTLVAAISDPMADDEDPSFTGDLLELFFSSTRAGSSDIWVSHRTNNAEPWGAPAMVVELSSSMTDRSPSVSLDGNAIWFASDRDPFRGRIWRSTRASRAAPWNPPAPVSELASPNFDTAPSVDAAQTTMFFASLRQQSTTGIDIYSSTRPAVGAPWGTPERVAGLDTALDESDPFVAQGGLAVYLTLSRTNQPGDLYWSIRRSTEAPFPPPQLLADVNSPAIDGDATLSVDLLYLMFASNRSGNTEIYESHALP
jgi:hypothetical protein